MSESVPGVTADDTTLDTVFRALADVCRAVDGVRDATADPPSLIPPARLPMAVPMPGAEQSDRSRSVGTVTWIHRPELVVFVTSVQGDYPRELPMVRRLIERIPSVIERAWVRRSVFGPRVASVKVIGYVAGLRTFGRDAAGEAAQFHTLTFALEIQIRETPGEMIG